MASHRASAAVGWVSLVVAAAAVPVAAVSAAAADLPLTVDALFWAIGFVVYPIAGTIILARRPWHPIGLLLCGIGIGVGATGATGLYALAYPAAPVAVWLAWASHWLWVPALGGVVALVLVFPDGRLLSRTWRPAAWLLGAAVTVLLLGRMFTPGELEDVPGFINPVGISAFQWPLVETGGIGWILFPAAIVAAVASVIVRYRRARGDERAQMKWLAYATAILGAGWIGMTAFWKGPETLAVAFSAVFNLGLMALPVAIGTAILTRRLYGIDIVISRTAVFAGLAAFITLAYVGIVVGVGSLVGGGTGDTNLELSIVATAVVAVLFQPVRDRLTRLANRLVYGRRATPYEVLSRFSAHLADTIASEETLDRMVRLLAEGTGAERAEVWLRVGGELQLAAASPTLDAASFTPRPLTEDGALPLEGGDVSVPVRHDGELLGALSIVKHRGDAVTPTERKIIEDLAAQAGLVLNNLRLTAELVRRLEQLRESRRRLVDAQDQERRRLERDLHDGAQQQVVAMKIKLAAARTRAERDGATAMVQILDDLRDDADETVESLRSLAHGIYPPLLAAEGLAAALRARVGRIPLAVTVTADDTLERQPQQTEAAIYFCVLEALQNVAKYAPTATVDVRLWQEAGEVAFEVSDDGPGFEPDEVVRGHGLNNMADRLDALAGVLTTESAPGAGTRVEGRIPTHDRTATTLRPTDG